MVYVTRSSNHTDWLRAHGVRASGTVLQNPPQSLRCGQVPVPIAIDVAGGVQEVEPYFVDGWGGGGLSQRDRVTVWYNPHDVADFIVNGKPNEHPLPTLLAVA